MSERLGEVVAVCTNQKRGQKVAVPEARFVRGFGVEGDAHGGNWHRQVSLLADERVDDMRAKGVELVAGAFGENLLVRGFDPLAFPIGRRFRVGDEVVLQLTQHRKECHTRCAIYYAAGECVMPTDGVFARVVRGGTVRSGDTVSLDPALDRPRWAAVTLSDKGARGEREDRSGPLLAERLGALLGGEAVAREVLPDDRKALEALLVELADEQIRDLIVTTGGTGLSPRDVTPEATQAVIDREVPGMAEAMRAAGLAKTPHAMLSRAVCGLRGQTLIVNLSGSPKAVAEQLDVLEPALPHALAIASGVPQDCAR